MKCVKPFYELHWNSNLFTKLKPASLGRSSWVRDSSTDPLGTAQKSIQIETSCYARLKGLAVYLYPGSGTVAKVGKTTE